MKPQSENIQVILTDLLRASGLEHISFHSSPFQISRNTSLQLGTADTIKFIAKISRNSIGQVGLGERHAYSELSSLIDSEDLFSVPKVLAGDERKGIVILEYIDGITFEKKLISSIRSGNSECIYNDFLLFGSLLSNFHKKYSENSADGVRLYVDYSPKNVLIRASDKKLFLIDLPGNKSIGRPEIDIGKGLFEVSRVLVKSKSLNAFKSFGRSRIAYLQGYFFYGRHYDKGSRLEIIHKEESRCFAAAVGNYLRFYRFEDYLYQFSRGMFMILILSLLRVFVFYFSCREKSMIAGKN